LGGKLASAGTAQTAVITTAVTTAGPMARSIRTGSMIHAAPRMSTVRARAQERIWDTRPGTFIPAIRGIMRRRRSVRAAILGAAALVGLVLPSAAQAAKRWAVVRQDGTLVRGRDVAAATRTGPGTYVITFDGSIRTCAYLANPGDPATGVVADPAVAAVSRRANPRSLSVQTYNESSESPADEPFHLFVACGATSPYAVVGRGGSLAHGSHALSARRIRRGEYSVHFDRDISSCVLTATIGSTGRCLHLHPPHVRHRGRPRVSRRRALLSQAARSRAARTASASSRTPGPTAGSGRWP
jgi:hypothetical protein